MLGDIEPASLRSALSRIEKQFSCAWGTFHNVDNSPEVKIIHRSLLIPHINIKGEEVDRCEGLPAKDFEKRG